MDEQAACQRSNSGIDACAGRTAIASFAHMVTPDPPKPETDPKDPPEIEPQPEPPKIDPPLQPPEPGDPPPKIDDPPRPGEPPDIIGRA